MRSTTSWLYNMHWSSTLYVPGGLHACWVCSGHVCIIMCIWIRSLHRTKWQPFQMGPRAFYVWRLTSSKRLYNYPFESHSPQLHIHSPFSATSHYLCWLSIVICGFYSKKVKCQCICHSRFSYVLHTGNTGLARRGLVWVYNSWVCIECVSAVCVHIGCVSGGVCIYWVCIGRCVYIECVCFECVSGVVGVCIVCVSGGVCMYWVCMYWVCIGRSVYVLSVYRAVCVCIECVSCGDIYIIILPVLYARWLCSWITDDSC